jgi:serine/threonine-protein kinase RsbW
MKMIAQRIPSKLENVAPFIREVLVLMKKFHLSEEETFHIKLSLEEALTNAMRHGNKLDPSLFVDVDLDVDDDKVIVKVKDQGEGFDEARLGDPTTGENNQKPGGRGVFLIRRLMNEVEYFDGGRGVKMIKFVAKKGRGRS